MSKEMVQCRHYRKVTYHLENLQGDLDPSWVKKLVKIIHILFEFFETTYLYSEIIQSAVETRVRRVKDDRTKLLKLFGV